MKPVPPTRIDKPNRHDDYELTHPAFGVVQITQPRGGGEGQRLFGSDLKHNTCMRITIRQASLVRGLSSDRTAEGPLVCQFEVSLSQWARLVSSVGNGSGTPITFNYRPDGNLIECPPIAEPEATKRELHGEEMAAALTERLDAIREHVARLGAMIDSGKISKTELREHHRELQRHAEQLPGSVQFVYDRFARATEKVADDAKTEVEAYVDGVAKRLGYETLAQFAPLLTNGKAKDGEA